MDRLEPRTRHVSSSPSLRLRGQDLWIFAYPEMQAMADGVLQAISDASQEEELPAVVAKRGGIKWGRFPDTFPNLFIDKPHQTVRGKHLVFFASFFHPESMFAQLSVLYHLPRYCARSLVVVLPYFATGTMERVDEEGQIATAMSLARLLSSIPPLGEGPAKLLIYDIHALGERFYFGDNIIPMFETAIPLVIDKIKTTHKDEEVAIAFPDEGAVKRFGGQFSDFDVITCSKVRGEGSKRTVTIKEGDPAGRHIFIIDDLVQTGGTLIECKNALLKQGATDVSAYVTHAIFPEDSWKRFTDPADKKPFKHFYITDSCPSVAEALKDKRPFSVLPLAEPISAFLREIA